jgi:hypothetical protein
MIAQLNGGTGLGLLVSAPTAPPPSTFANLLG